MTLTVLILKLPKCRSLNTSAFDVTTIGGAATQVPCLSTAGVVVALAAVMLAAVAEVVEEVAAMAKAAVVEPTVTPFLTRMP